LPDGFFSDQKFPLWLFWRALEWKMLLNILVLWNILRPMGIFLGIWNFCSLLVYFNPRWYTVTRKIWQPGSSHEQLSNFRPIHVNFFLKTKASSTGTAYIGLLRWQWNSYGKTRRSKYLQFQPTSALTCEKKKWRAHFCPKFSFFERC
jgi:hypothetical protein